jgi:spore coat protein U-like protein
VPGLLSRPRTRLAIVTLALVVAGAWRAEAACTIATTAMNFGTYSVFSATPTDTTSTFTADCGANDVNVFINFSKGSSSTYTPRTLRNGSEVLNYNIYADAARTLIVGDQTGGTVHYTSSRPGDPPQTLTLYGRIPAGQDVAVGTYTDTVLATINF